MFLKQDEDIKIGRKDIKEYLSVTLINLAKYKKIRMSARGTNTFTAERVARLFTDIGIIESQREDVIEDDQPTLKITLICKSINTGKTKVSKSSS